jgi:Anti-sigma-K factor rskA
MNLVTMNSKTEHPDLLGLLRGELTNAHVSVIADHLATCTECRDELSQVAVGHALLTGAGRTLTTSSPVVPVPETTPLDVRHLRQTNRKRWTRPALMLAAAAVLVGGTAGVTANLTGPDTKNPPIASPAEPSKTVQPAKTAVLQPIDSRATGQVLMADERDDLVEMTIATKGLPTLPKGQFYYVWLLKPETNKMLPVGVIDPDGKTTFTLPVKFISKYSAIDVSLEHDDGDPQHSITSVLRAEYT